MSSTLSYLVIIIIIRVSFSIDFGFRSPELSVNCNTNVIICCECFLSCGLTESVLDSADLVNDMNVDSAYELAFC